MTMQKKLSQKKLKALAHAHGLAMASVTGLTPLETSVKPLNDWQRAGYAGEMGYMQRPAELLCEPLKLCPEAVCAVCFAAMYERASAGERPVGSGRVARYAWGRDYHQILKERLSALLDTLEKEFGEAVRCRAFSDAVPLLERALAERAGLGFIGKNSLLIRPGTGSLFFLAEVFWDVSVEPDALAIATGTCGSCERCRHACPTQAIVADRVVDARRCISYLTIEKRGSFNDWERRALGEWVFGCDVCQEVCPFNYASLKLGEGDVVPEFRAAQGAGPYLDLSGLLKIRRSGDFQKRFSGTPLLRPKRAGLLRNAACVAANTLAEQCVPVLIETAGSDSEPLVREHAVWALREFETKGMLGSPAVFDYALKDPDERVRNEAKRFFEERREV